MIPSKIDHIELDDLQNLIENSVSESATIEYKAEVDLKTEQGKSKFLAGVSSFANASGGDFVIGIRAEKGIPLEVSGIELEDTDGHILRTEQLLASQIEPRLPQARVKAVPVADSKFVIVIRVDRSLSGPHRVKLGNAFYGRHAAGKYPLDMNEIRNAFLQTYSQADEARQFHAQRIDGIDSVAGLPGIPLLKGPRIVIHVIPISVQRENRLASEEHHALCRSLGGLRTGSYNQYVNLDGWCSAGSNEGGWISEYSQIFRNGTYEWSSLLDKSRDDDTPLLYGVAYCGLFLRLAEDLFKFYNQVEIPAPIYFFLSVVGAKGTRFVIPNSMFMDPRLLDRSRIVLPEVQLHTEPGKADIAFRPVFNALWNAFGMPACTNYDMDGRWRNG